MSVYVPVELQRRIRDRFSNRCAYCQTAEALTAMTFEFEHIVPHSAGGETLFENLCLACPSCNRHKATRQTGVDPVSRQRILLFHPQRQLWAEHFAWNEGATELVGLTDVGTTTLSLLQMNRPALVQARRLWVKLGEHPPSTS